MMEDDNFRGREEIVSACEEAGLHYRLLMDRLWGFRGSDLGGRHGSHESARNTTQGDDEEYFRFLSRGGVRLSECA